MTKIAAAEHMDGGESMENGVVKSITINESFHLEILLDCYVIVANTL